MDASRILGKAIRTIAERGKRYSTGNKRNMAQAVNAFNSLTGHDLCIRDGWIFMALVKVRRAVCDPTGEVDHYVDGAAYMALAGEEVTREKRKKPRDGK